MQFRVTAFSRSFWRTRVDVFLQSHLQHKAPDDWTVKWDVFKNSLNCLLLRIRGVILYCVERKFNNREATLLSEFSRIFMIVIWMFSFKMSQHSLCRSAYTLFTRIMLLLFSRRQYLCSLLLKYCFILSTSASSFTIVSPGFYLGRERYQILIVTAQHLLQAILLKVFGNKVR
jgi:hypothetical protein